MTRVVWTPLAELELEAIAEYVAEDRPKSAAGIVRRIREKAASLVEFPNRARAGRVKNTRELVVTDTRYIIAYRVTGDTVWIASVFDAARDYPSDEMN